MKAEITGSFQQRTGSVSEAANGDRGQKQLASFHHEIVDQPDADDPEDAPYQQTCAEGFKQTRPLVIH